MAFFCFEGVDGVGKSTQVDLFCQWLRDQGREVVACRDPGGTMLGEKIREILLHRSSIALSACSEMLLYMASRAQLVEEVIRPALEQGVIVVADRYLMANIVYQGRAGQSDIQAVREIGRIATDGLMPDLTFLLDMPVERAAQRLGRELDRMESRGLEFLNAVREGYHHEAAAWPAAVALLDADRPLDDLQREIRMLAKAYLLESQAALESPAPPASQR